MGKKQALGEAGDTVLRQICTIIEQASPKRETLSLELQRERQAALNKLQHSEKEKLA